ncbi:MAG: ribosome maturation factor RimM [Rhodanobacteraceae bacterium]
MSTTERRVEVGRIVGLHGVRGGLRLESWTDPRTGIFSYQPWTLVRVDGAERQFDGARGHSHGKGLLTSLPGIEDREQAREWIGARVIVPRSALPKAGPGEYYWADLEGLQAVNMEGIDLGRVDRVLATGANDVLVAVDDTGRERLLPFVLDVYIKEVDLDAGRLLVDWDPDF